MSHQILIGDCTETLRTLPDQSVHCCVTSPPYYALRDYGYDGQLGLEPTLPDYIAALVEVFREVRRVLRDDGTLWLNLGDTYASSGGPGWQGKNGQRADRRFTATRDTVPMREQSRTAFDGFKPKDLMGVPWRVAFALQSEGWYLRQDIIWAKPNPMPESVRDRCTKSHEYIFLLSKSAKYYFDAEAIAEPLAASSIQRLSQPNLDAQVGSTRVQGKTNGTMKAVGPRFGGAKYGDDDSQQSRTKSGKEWGGNETGKRNKRTVWTVATRPYKGAHFATFPPALIEPCILAGCPKCGTVLDPFGGTGTTAEVALKLGRSVILCEINPDSVALAEERIASALEAIKPSPQQPLFDEATP